MNNIHKVNRGHSRTDWRWLAVAAAAGVMVIKSFYVCLSPEYLIITQHTGMYSIVSKGMRLIAQGKDPLEGQRHMCGMGNLFNYHSTGYPELDELMRTPQPLIFIMELVQVSTERYGRSDTLVT